MAKPQRILNIEDSIGKHWDVNQALSWNECPTAAHATDATTGLDMIEKAIAAGCPFDLLITDMFFPISPGGSEKEAGLYVIDELERRGIDMPIIVCSSARYYIPSVLGCIYYTGLDDLKMDLQKLLEQM